MNRKEIVNISQPSIPAYIIRSIIKEAEKTSNIEEDRDSSTDVNLCNTLRALTSTSTAINVLNSIRSLKCTSRSCRGRKAATYIRKGCHFIDHTRNPIKDAFHPKPRESILPLALSSSLKTSQKIIDQAPVSSLLLFLVVGLLCSGEPLVKASGLTNITSSSNSPSRSIRTPKLLTDELNNEILVQTIKHGFFKGRLMSSDRLPLSRIPNEAADTSVDVVGFLGIRYASAPTRRLRFMPPTAYHYPSNQVHDMQHFGPICRQRLPIDLGLLDQLTTATSEYGDSQLKQHRQQNTSLNLGQSMRPNTEPHLRLIERLMTKESFDYLQPVFKKLYAREQSEDCLNLNIYVPKEALTDGRGQIPPPKPVLVIIHGESFDYGAGSIINAFKFAQQTRFIAITFNYRLNILGFPPKLPGASRGNLGLMDQVAALHWIKDNIGSFGGSPNNITLMGTKRGAIFVNLLMLSPLAKGLFQRAILEDGSALSPIVANHIISSIGAHVASSSLGSLPAIQHVRVLAKLCDCPVYQRAQAKPFFTNSSQFNAATSGADNQQHRQHQPSIADEIKTNALMFECLRAKPIEQIMQPVPLDLLEFNQANGELNIVARWLRSAASSLLAAQVDSTSSEAQILSQYRQELAPVDAGLIGKLVHAAIREQMSYESTNDGPEPRVSELFRALYAPPSASVRPLFGPVEDGTIVPEEDVATGMLKTGSTFAQRDLLIGLSQPAISATDTSLFDKTTLGDTTEHNPSFELGADHMLADRVTAQIQRAGLTNEQAVNLVDVFVRSFYRYHNQEITNSIVNHYLSNGRGVKSRKTDSVRTSNDEHNQNGTKESKITQQQIFVLNSLLEAFHDALTNVPVLKVALIHAIKQLDPLAEVFVGKEFEKWKENEQANGGDSSQFESQVSMNQLYESFTVFAQSLFNDTNWPLQLHSQNQAVQQPKATYLYQFDSSSVLRKLRRLIDQFESKRSIGSGWSNVKDSIEKLSMNLQESGNRRRVGLGCILSLDTDDNYSDEDNSNEYVQTKFTDWICSKFNRILESFIATGNVNSPLSTEDLVPREEAANWLPISERIARFDTECLNYNQQLHSADHHSVQVTSSGNQVQTINGTCKRELNHMVLDYLFSEFDPQVRRDKGPIWTVFNIFSQHVATVPSQKDLWHVGPVLDDEFSVQYEQKSTFSARSSFWANYVPALNCSKTQPVIPTALLSNSLASINSKSSILSLNLLFNCQHGGKTSYELFETLVQSIRQQLQSKVTHWRQSRSNMFAGQQNHHSLRMANMGQTNTPDDAIDQQEHLAIESNRYNSTAQTNLAFLNDFIGANSSGSQNANLGHTSSDIRTKYVGMVLIACVLLVSITLISGAFAIIRQRRQKKEQRRKSLIDLDVIVENHPQDEERLTSLQKSSLSNSDMNDLETAASQKVCGDDKDVIISGAPQLGPDCNLHNSPAIQSGHVCAHDNQNGYIFWQGGQQALLDNSVTLCKSRSSFAVANDDGSNNLNTFLNTMPNSNEQSKTGQEPIMMPILTSSSQDAAHHHQHYYQSQASSLRRVSCHGNSSAINGFHGESSSETQDLSRASNSKKRVKISDPLATAKRTSKFVSSNSSYQISMPIVNSQIRSSETQYCPVHRDQIAQGYYVDGFVTTSDELWARDQTDLLNYGQYMANECDSYALSNNTSQKTQAYGSQECDSKNDSKYISRGSFVTENEYRQAANSYHSNDY